MVIASYSLVDDGGLSSDTSDCALLYVDISYAFRRVDYRPDPLVSALIIETLFMSVSQVGSHLRHSWLAMGDFGFFEAPG